MSKYIQLIMSGHRGNSWHSSFLCSNLNGKDAHEKLFDTFYLTNNIKWHNGRTSHILIQMSLIVLGKSGDDGN